MVPSAREIEEMARLKRIVSGDLSAVTPSSSQVFTPPTHGAPQGSSDPASVAAMRDVLANFYAASGGAARSMVKEAERDPYLREAMNMTETQNGAKIGEWEIEVRQDGGRKLYDIIRGDEQIAADLTLYEAALGIVRALNNGKFITSVAVRDILKDEAEYAAALHDAILFKRRLNESQIASKKPVFEARYSDARARAVAARDRIKKRVADLDD